MKKKRHKPLHIDVQETLAQVSAGNIPSTWRVYRASRKKIVGLILFVCTFIALFLGFLFYMLEISAWNPSYYPPMPASFVLFIFSLMGGAILIAISFSVAMWVTMKDMILVLTPAGFVYGDSMRRKWGVDYQDIEEMMVGGNGVAITLKTGEWNKKQLDLSWFTSPKKEAVASLVAQFENFTAKRIEKDTTIRTWQKGVSLDLAEIEQAAQESQLGKLVQVFPTDEQGLRTSFRISLLFIFFGGIGFILLISWERAKV